MIRKRTLYNTILSNLDRKEYLIITGARQVGKTTLIQQLFHNLKSQNERVYYITLEDPEILAQLNLHPENVFKYIERPVNPLLREDLQSPQIYLFIDEIQYLNDPSNFLKYLFDTYLQNLKIVATGSSAFYLSKNVKDSLAGRKRIFNLSVLSFSEYLEFKESSLLMDELLKIKENREYHSLYYKEILENLNEYIIYGGYPALVLEKDLREKKIILDEIKTSFLQRDIFEAGVQQASAFYKLLVLLAEQSSNLVNRNELSRTIGIDNKTVDAYIDVLIRCYHIDLIRPFSGNLRNELVKMPKVYFRDTGFRNALLNRMYPLENRDDKGALLENYIYNRLTEMYSRENIRFWRTAAGDEVDFVVKDDANLLTALEVKFSVSGSIKSGLTKLKQHYPEISTNIIAYNHNNNSLPVLKL